ncbi:MAG: cyclic pyranopterin monophosphate synthase MoaC [Xanthomonadales bacterium]|nr:cyclic pyranopterin monophosphate synthase MoaC [Xanthomonadales bacterium]NIO14017.1 cyclic pyranopterin monophosphate synthase MoaC [Xanthomonadales bacterium]
MADVSAKPVTRRRALAVGRIHIGAEAFERLREGRLPKGDPLAMAEIVGMQAAKRTPSLLPLCHPLPLNRVTIHSVPQAETQAIEIYALAEAEARTGVEMEALCGVSVALMAVWDLLKPVNPALEVGGVRLLYKEGGKQGRWVHPDGMPPAAQALLDAD